MPKFIMCCKLVGYALSVAVKGCKVTLQYCQILYSLFRGMLFGFRI